MRGEKVDRRRAAHDLRMQMKDLQFRLGELGTTGGSDSDKSICRAPGRAAAEDEGSLREVPYQAREIPWERLQQMGVMGEALQICGKGERLDRSGSYRGITGLLNVLGCGRVRDRSTQV